MKLVSGKLRIDSITRQDDGQCSVQFRPANDSQDVFVVASAPCGSICDMDLDYLMVLDPYYPIAPALDNDPT